MIYANKTCIFLPVCIILGFVNGHLAVLAVKMECQHLTGTQTQVPRFLVLRIRIRLAAVPEFKQQAVFASHQMIVFRLHSFKMLMGIK